MFESFGDVSLDLLRAFEVAARLRSFTAAALELGTTQPAVSQQIKRLEEQLATRLFDRIYRGIELTDAGEVLFSHVQAGLQSIDSGLIAITEHHQHEVLQVATDFAFAAYWLMPRLHRFHKVNPDVDVSLVTSERTHSMLRADIDVAVLFGDGRFKQGESHWLFSEEVFPVCSPQLLAGRQTPLPNDALRDATPAPAWRKHQPLVRLGGRIPRAGHPQAPAPGQLRFDNYTLLIQAAIGGQGIAIGWRHLVDDLLDQGLLCRPIAGAAISGQGYYVVLPQRKRRVQIVQQFVDWLASEQALSGVSLTGRPLPSIAV